MTVAERLRMMTAEHLGIEEKRLTDATRFEELGMDSLDPIEMSMQAEDEYDIAVDEPELATVKTFGDWVRLVEGKVAARKAA